MQWNELRNEIEDIIREKSSTLGLTVVFDVNFIENAPIDGEYIYGEAFPEKNRIWLEVVAPDISMDEITETICHELIHLKFPNINHNSPMFNALVSTLL